MSRCLPVSCTHFLLCLNSTSYISLGQVFVKLLHAYDLPMPTGIALVTIYFDWIPSSALLFFMFVHIFFRYFAFCIEYLTTCYSVIIILGVVIVNTWNNWVLLSFVCAISYTAPSVSLQKRRPEDVTGIWLLLKISLSPVWEFSRIHLSLLCNHMIGLNQFSTNIFFFCRSPEIFIYSMVRRSSVHPLHQPLELYKLRWRYVY